MKPRNILTRGVIRNRIKSLKDELPERTKCLGTYVELSRDDDYFLISLVNPEYGKEFPVSVRNNEDFEHLIAAYIRAGYNIRQA